MLKFLKLATRNLSRNRRRTAISLVALVVGVTVMIALGGFINGQQRTMLEGIVQGAIGPVQVHKTGYLANVQALPLTFEIADTPQLRETLGSVKHVTVVAPRIAFGAMISTPDVETPGREPTEDEQGRTAYFQATAIDPIPEQKVTPKRWDWVGGDGGRMFTSAAAPEVVLNADFNSGLGAKLMTDPSHAPPETQWPALLAADQDGSLNGVSVRLSGTQVSAFPGDRKIGLVPLATAQKLLRMEGKVTEYAIGVDDLDHVDAVKAELQKKLGPEFEVSGWDDIIPFVRTLFNAQNIVFGVITGIFLTIVLLGVVNTLLMSVLERVREIGTMLAVGMRRSQIVGLFVLEGAVLGLVGGLLGAALGTLVVLWMRHHGINLPAPGSTVPAVVRPFVSPLFVLRSVVLATIGCAVVSIYPALRASKLRPVEALASV